MESAADSIYSLRGDFYAELMRTGRYSAPRARELAFSSTSDQFILDHFGKTVEDLAGSFPSFASWFADYEKGLADFVANYYT